MDGKKTYILAIVAIVSALGSYFIGELSLQEAIAAAWLGGVAAAGRHAISKLEARLQRPA